MLQVLRSRAQKATVETAGAHTAALEPNDSMARSSVVSCNCVSSRFLLIGHQRAALRLRSGSSALLDRSNQPAQEIPGLRLFRSQNETNESSRAQSVRIHFPCVIFCDVLADRVSMPILRAAYGRWSVHKPSLLCKSRPKSFLISHFLPLVAMHFGAIFDFGGQPPLPKLKINGMDNSMDKANLNGTLTRFSLSKTAVMFS